MKRLKRWVARLLLAAIATLVAWVPIFALDAKANEIPIYAELLFSAILVTIFAIFVWIIGRLVICAFD